MFELSAWTDVSVPILVFLLIIPVLVIEWLNRKDGRTSRKARRTQCLLVSVFVSSAIFASASLVLSTVCWHCTGQIALWFFIMFIMRAINLAYLVHRAKLAQGMQPVLGRKCFEKILPICMPLPFFLAGIRCAQRIYFVMDARCVAYIDSEIFHHCWDIDSFVNIKEERMAYIVMVVINFLLTAFLLTLFVVPLYRVYRSELGSLNENQKRQRLKLRNLLIWSVALTFINQVTSTLHAIYIFGGSPLILALWTISKFDPAINVWTSWLMITRNRLYLRRLGFRCCGKSGGERRMIQSVITDIDSKRSSRRSGTGRLDSLVRGSSISEVEDVQLQMTRESERT